LQQLTPEINMPNGKMTQVGNSRNQLYGPRKLLVCGYAPKDQERLLNLLDEEKLEALPVIFISKGNQGRTLQELLAFEDYSGLDQKSSLPRTLIMSGLTEKELHQLMIAYRKSGMAPQMWATLTPISENWVLRNLLKELQAENAAMRRRQAGQNARIHDPG